MGTLFKQKKPCIFVSKPRKSRSEADFFDILCFYYISQLLAKKNRKKTSFFFFWLRSRYLLGGGAQPVKGAPSYEKPPPQRFWNLESQKVSFGLVWNAIFSEIVGTAFCGFFMQENRVFWPLAYPRFLLEKFRKILGRGVGLQGWPCKSLLKYKTLWVSSGEICRALGGDLVGV